MSKTKVSLALVEDDPDEKEIFISFLKDRTDLGPLSFFESGPALLQHLEVSDPNELPGFILLDHNMPRVTGLQVLQELKKSQRFRHIPVVVYSTYVDAGLAERCRRAGAIDVFTKPLTGEGYNEMMNQILDKINPSGPAASSE